MKPALYLSLVAPLLIYVGCADEEVPPGPGPAVGGSQASGGITSSGGTTPTTGGTTGPTGGTTGPSGGTAGSTGGTVNPVGGSGGASTGGITSKGGSGGASTGGGGGSAVGGSGGASTGGTSGGETGTGGVGGSAAGMGGMGGMKSDLPTPATLAPGLDGHLITTPCRDQPMTDDCDSGGWKSTAVDNFAAHACMNARLEANIVFPVAGVPGTAYDVTMHFYGVMEPRQYANVMREAMGRPSLTGGTPTSWAEAPAGTTITGAGDQNYNTYEIHVYNESKQEVRAYFLNADSTTGHYTMVINYEKTIEVIGGGEVRLRVFDANCRMIKNCGAEGQWPCANKARSVNIAAASPAPTMAQLSQPGLGLAPEHSGQWWLIDVTNVALAAP